MNVAGYVRVSTDNQADKGYSIGEQTERLTAYCAAKDWELVKVYTDPGFSGKDINRPALQRLMEEISAYDIVLVNKLDRLSRSQKDTLYLIQDVFAPAGCAFVSMQESFDTTTPIGIAMVGILSAFAQLERSQIKERTKMGREGRKKKGLWHGGVNIPTGYDYDNGLLMPNNEADQVRLIFQKYLEGESIRDITRYLQAHYTTRYTSWNNACTVRRILANPIYIGMIGEYPGQHTALIDRETWDRVQVKLDSHKKGGVYPTGNHLLTGMARCGYCGARVRCCASTARLADGSKKKYIYYRCGRTDSTNLSLADHKCSLAPQKEVDVDAAVAEQMRNLRLEDLKPRQTVAVDNSAEIEKIGHQLSRLIDLYAVCDGDVAELTKKITALKKKRDALMDEQTRPAKVPLKVFEDSIAIIQKALSEGDILSKRAVLETLADHVTLYNDRVEVQWKVL